MEKEMFKLTIPQQNIWNLQKYYEATSIGNICGAVFYDDKRDHEILAKAVNKEIELQAGLRLRFREENGEPIQYISDYVPVEIPFKSFDTQEEFDKFAEQYAKKTIGLIERQMHRFTVFEVEGRTGVIVTASHLVSDAWTFSIFAREVTYFYDMLSSGNELLLTPHSYEDYIKSEQKYFESERYKKDKAYWEEKYTVKPEFCPIKYSALPVSVPTAERYTRTISEDVTKKIDKWCADNKVSQAVLFEAAFSAYLSKINSENKTITIGIPVLNRTNSREKEIVGMLISTIPLTIAVSPEDTAISLCENLTAEHMALFRHQKYPYSHILKYIREKHDFNGNLYDVMISYQNAKTDTGAKTKWYSNGFSEVPFAFHIDNRDSADCYTMTIDYQTEVFRQPEEIELIAERILFVIDQITENSNITINDINIVPAAEYQKIIYDFNDTAVDYPKDKCVHELFVEQVQRTPDKIALVFEDKKFTYKQLDDMSNSLAHYLREEIGIKPNDVVPIIAKRSWHIIVAMLGILKAGGAYMPIDPSYPYERIKYILDLSKPKIVLEYNWGKDYHIDSKNLDLYKFDYYSNIDYINNINNPNDLSYIIFTSGSTGKPKGVSQKHICLTNLICWQIRDADNCFIKNIMGQVIITFDVSVQEIVFSLLSEKCLYFTNEEVKNNIFLFLDFVKNNNIDTLFVTPSYFSILRSKDKELILNRLKTVFFAGEKLELTNSFFELYKNVSMYNQYGPAETAVISSSGKLSNQDITIGKPIDNTQIYIIDENQKPLPIGVAGELCISGDGVGKGYLNCPELTAEKFIPNPFIEGKTMYCTGDLACWRDDGEIEYLGRIDTQVKIRGLRIELGEIESVISGFTGINMVAVTDKRDESGRQYLVGYYTSDKEVDETALRKLLSSKLPKYMVPNYFMRLETMPMTTSGKIDRKALPMPVFAVNEQEYLAPINETEKELESIIGKLLKLDKVSRTDDIFDLGGDSLMAISLLSEIEQHFNVQITMKDIIENPSIDRLADIIDRSDEKSITIKPLGKDKYRLLPQQKAIYAVCNKNPGTLTYNMPVRIALSSDIDREKIKSCLTAIVEHHRSLKTYIKSDTDDVYGVYDADTRICFEKYSDNNISDFVRPFDLSKAPLIRFAFTETSLLFDMHHIIGDGETINIILRDLANLYGGGKLTDVPVQYSDYSEYFYSQDHSAHKVFFKEMLKCDFEPVVLPEKKYITESRGTSKFYNIKNSVFDAAKKFAHRNGLTDTMLFLGAWGILLSKYTAKNDILSSIIMSNRIHSEIKDTAGMFVNTLPVFMNVTGSVSDYFNSVKNTVLGIYEYQELPFFDIAEFVGMKDKSVINTSFVYQADGTKMLDVNGESFAPELIETHTAKFDLSFELTPSDNGCTLRIEYNTDKYDDSLIERLYKGYIRILEQLSSEMLADISVLDEDEYNKVIFDFNDTAADYPKDKCDHEHFAEQVQRTPDKISLIFEDKKFTYKQLDEMSNSLAHYLREEIGIKSNDVVPVIAKRSWHIIIAMLGILKSGGAYLLIDYQYPNDRIDHLVSECKSDVIITFGYRYESIKKIIKLDKFDFNKSNDIFCSSHTSGSTGVPKLSILTHRNINHYIKYASAFFENVNQTIASTTIAFDAFVQETIVSLCNNTTVILLNEYEIANVLEFEKQIDCYYYSFNFQTPTKILSYINNCNDVSFLKHISSIIIGGEVFSSDLYDIINRVNPNCRIYNIYGPTETTICVTTSQLNNNDITIGKPIANTQIYILDKDRKPLPIGVAGELCISGDGVGKGYLNRPELTAEKFIPNPFIKGKTMYCTGDLARWRDDGEIEYLGRIDTQVKIRGLRIELGEIESVMSGFTGINMVAVTDKRDESGRQYLVGYYTSEKAVDEVALRKLLSSKLPKYMVPNYFMRLDEMPMTASGKTDRKNLPVPEFKTDSDDYVAPDTDNEKALCSLLEEMMSIEKVGVNDDFFGLGGDSLMAIEYVTKAHNLGIEFSLQNVFDSPTVKELCQVIENGIEKHKIYSADDFIKYEKILSRNIIDDSFVPVKHSLGNVLLTGATGFLGSHILDELMRSETGKIYCLVRSISPDDRRGRWQEKLNYYFGDRYKSEIGKRIIPVIGDITYGYLSKELPDDVHTVIHTAATVKHYGSYEYFNEINVNGTRNVVDYAKRIGAKLIHISTLSVSGNSLADEFSVYRSSKEKNFYEHSLYIEQPLDNVYVRSKFEAELAVLDGVLSGLDAKIIRVGNLTNRQSDQRFQPNYESNAFLTRFKAVLELGLFPDYLIPLYAEFSPIDKTANAVVKIAQYADVQNVFHLNSNKPIYFDELLEVLKRLGIKMTVVSGKEFNDTLQKKAKDTNTEYIYEAFQNDMDEDGKLIYDSNIHILNDFTVNFLKKIGFEWDKTDYEYIKKYVEYFRNLGYFKI